MRTWRSGDRRNGWSVQYGLMCHRKMGTAITYVKQIAYHCITFNNVGGRVGEDVVVLLVNFMEAGSMNVARCSEPLYRGPRLCVFRIGD